MNLGKLIEWTLIGDLVAFGVFMIMCIALEGQKLLQRRRRRWLRRGPTADDMRLMTGSESLNEQRARLKADFLASLEKKDPRTRIIP